MAEERFYLELSEDGGTSHKFYEVIVSDKTLSIRFGRIGDKGQTQVKDFADHSKALAEANKKLAEKRKKGYAEAVMGERKKRSVTRREIVSQVAAKSVTKAPVIWRFTPTSSRAFGVFIDEARCWMGNEAGMIYSLDHDGKVLDQFKLPDGVKCIVADEDWLYAGCDDGKVYDLGGKVPRVAYEIAENIDIFWLDIKDGVLGVSDEAGNVGVFNHEDESQWMKKSSGSSGWMIRCDELRRVPRPHQRRDDVRLGRRQAAVALQDRRLGAVRLAGRVDGLRRDLEPEGAALQQARHRSEVLQM